MSGQPPLIDQLHRRSSVTNHLERIINTGPVVNGLKRTEMCSLLNDRSVAVEGSQHSVLETGKDEGLTSLTYPTNQAWQ